MNAAMRAVRKITASTRTRAGSCMRILSAGVSGVMLAVTVLVCVQVRTELRRSRFWIEMAQGQLRQVQEELAHARSDRAALLIRRSLRPMAAELPAILRMMPAARAPQQIIATADAWRIVRQTEPGTMDREEVIFSRTRGEERVDAAHLGS
jgi:hypothetical protein